MFNTREPNKNESGSIASRASIIVAIAAGAALLNCGDAAKPVERSAQASAAISGGTDDNGDYHASSIVEISDVSKGLCNGVLISSTAVLTANHCITGSTAKGTPPWGRRPAVRISTGGSLTTGPAVPTLDPLLSTSSPIDTLDQAAYDIAILPIDPDGTQTTDGAFIEYSMRAEIDACRQKPADPSFGGGPKHARLEALRSCIRNSTWMQLLEIGITHPSLTVPPHSGAYTFDQGERVASAAYANRLGALRQIGFFDSLTESNGTWLAPGFNVPLEEEGDSGSPLFGILADGSRDPFGIMSTVEVADNNVTVGQHWADITRDQNAAFIRNAMAQPRPDAWKQQHPLPTGRVEPWWRGETEYTGPCRTDVDTDCDHWTDAHDDCPAVFNPEQNGCHCPYDPWDDEDNDGVCAVAAPLTRFERFLEEVYGIQIQRVADNCPQTPNHDQADANFTAEHVLATQIDPSNDGHAPIAGDAPLYVDTFSSSYPGDACDYNEATAVTTFTASTQAPAAGCRSCRILPDGSLSCKNLPPSSCTSQINTGLNTHSWVAGKSATWGTVAPAYCLCSQATTSVERCAQAAFGCPIASDSSFPTPGGGVTGTSSWQTITLPYVSSANYKLDTLFQPTSDVSPAPFGGEDIVWDFTKDVAAFGYPSAMTGVLWTHDLTIGDAPSFSNGLHNGYSPLDPKTVSKTSIAFPPGSLPTAAMSSAPAAWKPTWKPAGFAIPSQGAHAHIAFVRQGDDVIPVAQLGQDVSFATDRFTRGALELLREVVAGDADLIIGDDAAVGIPQRAKLIVGVVVQRATSSVLGALYSDGSTVEGLRASQPRTSAKAAASALQAYAAEHGELLSLSTSRRGATLTRTNVFAALAAQTVTDATLTVTGEVPVEPLAVAWNGIDRHLVVVDALPAASKRALRLLKVTLDGVSTELWRTGASATLPRVFLSVSPQDEIVLSIASNGISEFVLLDRHGQPKNSSSVAGSLLSAAVANAAGVTFPLSQPMNETSSNLNAHLTRRSESAPRICGTKWLLAHADRTTANVLASAALACGR